MLFPVVVVERATDAIELDVFDLRQPLSFGGRGRIGMPRVPVSFSGLRTGLSTGRCVVCSDGRRGCCRGVWSLSPDPFSWLAHTFGSIRDLQSVLRLAVARPGAFPARRATPQAYHNPLEAQMPDSPTLQQISGSDLRVGDTLELWWGRDTITALAPYTGPLASVFAGGAQSASFARGPGMTIENGMLYPVVARMGGEHA